MQQTHQAAAPLGANLLHAVPAELRRLQVLDLQQRWSGYYTRSGVGIFRPAKHACI